VPYSFFTFNADIHRETAVYVKIGRSEEWGAVALWLPKIQKRLRNEYLTG
jgi:hypothetical protein